MELTLTAILTFLSTNIDDLFVLSLFFGNRRYKHQEVVGGQYLGILSLTGLSLALSLMGLWMDPAYIGLLGFFPVYLGLKGLWTRIRNNNSNETIGADDQSSNHHGNILTVAGVTFANGGDNIGVYVPLFATMGWMEKGMMVGIFVIMTGLWCLTAKYLAGHPYVSRMADKYGHTFTPFILIVLGLYILSESGAFGILK